MEGEREGGRERGRERERERGIERERERGRDKEIEGEEERVGTDKECKLNMSIVPESLEGVCDVCVCIPWSSWSAVRSCPVGFVP